MAAQSFPVRFELDGWTLLWAALEMEDGGEGLLDELRREVFDDLRARLTPGTLTALPAVAAMRLLFRRAGTDPTRYRPSSEALLRRVLKSGSLPSIHPLVDVNNLLSLQLAAPCCVVAEGTINPPITLRSGRGGERMESLRGDMRLDGRPLLEDASGAFGTPISDSRRVMVREETRRGWLVAYLPTGVVDPDEAEHRLFDLAGRSGRVQVEPGSVFASP